MFGMTRGPTEEYIKQLQKDFDEVRHLANSAPFINYIPDEKYHPPTLYDIYVDIRSIVAVDKESGKIDYKQGFKCKIKLSPNNPLSKPECVVTPVPFHPHFKPEFRQGVWVDPYEKDEGLGQLLLRIVHSLKYEPSYIDEQCRNIGNEDALLWYMRIKQKSPNFFPIDKKELPHTLHITDKTLTAQPKKFEIQNNQEITAPLPTYPLESVPSPRKKFEIVESTPVYEPVVKSLSKIDTFLHSDFLDPQSGYELLITERAKNQIFEHIGWGEKTELNQVEQGGIFLGQVFKDTQKGIIYGVVEEALPGESAKGTGVYLEMDHSTWKTMIDRADQILDVHKDNLQIIGWYHTHPNHLDVFMSSTDIATQSRLFSQDWHFAVVINPHKKIWRVFHGKNSKECMGFIIGDSEKYIPVSEIQHQETYPNSIDQNEDRYPLNENQDKLPIKNILVMIVIVLFLGIISLVFINGVNPIQEIDSVSPTALGAIVFVTPYTLPGSNKSSFTATITTYLTLTPVPIETSMPTSISSAPTEAPIPTSVPAEIFTPTLLPVEPSFTPILTSTAAISRPLPLTNSTMISSSVNIPIDVCLKTDKLYQFEAQAPINIYNIYVSTDDPVDRIQQKEIFLSGSQSSGKILGVISINNKDWFYITYQENRYWVSLDDLFELAICIP